jgi:hypothetical protein
MSARPRRTTPGLDVLTIPDDDIMSTQFAYSIVGGRVMHRAQAPAQGDSASR